MRAGRERAGVATVEAPGAVRGPWVPCLPTGSLAHLWTTPPSPRRAVAVRCQRCPLCPAQPGTQHGHPGARITDEIANLTARLSTASLLALSIREDSTNLRVLHPNPTLEKPVPSILHLLRHAVSSCPPGQTSSPRLVSVVLGAVPAQPGSLIGEPSNEVMRRSIPLTDHNHAAIHRDGLTHASSFIVGNQPLKTGSCCGSRLAAFWCDRNPRPPRVLPSE